MRKAQAALEQTRSNSMSQLAALQIVIPLVAAPLCVILYWPRLTWFIATTVSFSCFLISLVLLDQVQKGSA